MHPNCHYQIAFVKLNLKIEYTPLYERLIWDYNNSNVQLINCAIENFIWKKSFEGKNVHEQFYLFKKIILHIFHNFIPNKIFICNDKDSSWFTDEIRRILNEKNELFKQFFNNGELKIYYYRLECIRGDLVESVWTSKEKIHLRLLAKLSNPSISVIT